jgi:hypothetical protein
VKQRVLLGDNRNFRTGLSISFNGEGKRRILWNIDEDTKTKMCQKWTPCGIISPNGDVVGSIAILKPNVVSRRPWAAKGELGLVGSVTRPTFEIGESFGLSKLEASDPLKVDLGLSKHGSTVRFDLLIGIKHAVGRVVKHDALGVSVALPVQIDLQGHSLVVSTCQSPALELERCVSSRLTWI